jgi:hypothetical protein
MREGFMTIACSGGSENLSRATYARAFFRGSVRDGFPRDGVALAGSVDAMCDHVELASRE